MLVFSAILVLGFLSSSAHAAPVPTYVSRTYPAQHFKGFVRTAKTEEFFLTAPRKSFSSGDGPVPGTTSMREKAGPVEDQGQCGSCWDFSLTSVLRGTWIMAGRDPGRLSFNYLLNCATDQQGCNGGDFNAAAWFVHPKGVPSYGSDGEYTESGGQCVSKPAVADAVAYHMLGAAGGSPSFRDIAYVVGVLHRPVSVDVAVDDNWEAYANGVYNLCTDQNINDINHMVSVEGYDCETSVDANGNCAFDAKGNLPPGVGTWLIRNSWGDSWGDSGYITTRATSDSGQRCDMVGNDALYFDVSGE